MIQERLHTEAVSYNRLAVKYMEDLQVQSKHTAIQYHLFCNVFFLLY